MMEEKFKRLIDRGLARQCYIVCSPVRSAQESFARSAAALLEQGAPTTDPLKETHIVEAHEGEAIGIDVVRYVQNFLNQRPIFGKRRIVIIQHAEQMTSAAQHAILKTAEEASSHICIFLLVRDPDALLPTVRSRFQFLYIPARIDAGFWDGREDDQNIVHAFLHAVPAERSALIKTVVGEEREWARDFVDMVVWELSKDMKKNAPALASILAIQERIQYLAINKRLQLEAVSHYITETQ